MAAFSLSIQIQTAYHYNPEVIVIMWRGVGVGEERMGGMHDIIMMMVLDLNTMDNGFLERKLQ